MKWKVGNKSIEQGLNQSRLPAFAEEEITRIQGTGDFFALNSYTSLILRDEVNNNPPHYEDDQVYKMDVSSLWYLSNLKLYKQLK